MHRLVPLLLLLLCSCTTLPVYVQDPSVDTAVHIEGIERVWAVEVEVVDTPECAVVLHPTDDHKGVDCAGNDVLGCSAGRDIWCPAKYGGLVCAHEVGHTAGLNHATEDMHPRNVMQPTAGPDNDAKSARQQKAVRALSALLRGCQELKRIREERNAP
jgi:hypothetical protein